MGLSRKGRSQARLSTRSQLTNGIKYQRPSFGTLATIILVVATVVLTRQQNDPTSPTVDVLTTYLTSPSTESFINAITTASSTSSEISPFQHGKVVAISPAECQAAEVISANFADVYAKGRWGARIQPLTNFYSNAEWPPKERASASGTGSNLGYMTSEGLRMIREAIQKHEITTMMDIPCGDVNWVLDSVETDHTLQAYIGLDVVPQLVAFNQERFKHHSNKFFQIWDGASCPLPKIQLLPVSTSESSALVPPDLVHVRDVLQHLKLQQGVQFLCHVVQSGAKILITTTFPGQTNRDLAREGAYFPNDLSKAPYDLVTDEKSCTRSHLSEKEEKDVTCVYDLQQPWTKEWEASHCHDKQ